MMFAKWKNRMPMAVGIALMVVALGMMARSEPVQAQREGVDKFAGGSRAGANSNSRYTVIETQGFNLLVTDNTSDKLYYYATDKDAPIGSPMKLRASLDLTQIGKEEIKITAHNLENTRKKE